MTILTHLTAQYRPKTKVTLTVVLARWAESNYTKRNHPVARNFDDPFPFPFPFPPFTVARSMQLQCISSRRDKKWELSL